MSEEELEQQQQPGYLEAQQTEIKYTFARFHRRVFANLVDFILFAFTFLLLFLGIRAIVVNTPGYIQNEETILSTRLDSAMYMKYENGKIADTVSFLSDSTNNYTGYAKMETSRRSIETFIAYVNEKGGAEASAKVQKDYDSYRLDPKLVYESVAYFMKTEAGDIIRNEACKANAETYFSKAYAPFIDEHCQGYLITLVPGYLELVRYESNILIWAELFPAYVAAPFLTYLLPMMIFRRGRMTFGKALYHIGTVNRDLLVPSVKRTLARFTIFYLAELILAPVTFAIPFLVSASLMAFSKSHQGLPDYFLGLYEVDVTNDKIYFSREEILFSGVGGEKQPVDFQPTYED